MKLNVIHLKERIDRFQLLENQLHEQHIRAHTIWEGIKLENNPKQGIARAHKQIVAFAKNEKMPSILIAEDDVKFTALGAFDFFLQNEPTSYDMYLGGITYGNIDSQGITKDFAGLHLYKIRNEFYDSFLSLPENIDLDRALAGIGKYVVCNPFAAVQHNGYSDNKKKSVDYDLYFKDRKLYSLD